MAELRGNSEAQKMLLRAMLTNEFLGASAHMFSIEKDVAEITNTMVWVEANLALLKDSAFENRVHRKARRLVNEALDVVWARAVQGPTQMPASDFIDAVGDAEEDGRISADQLHRINDTDLILRAKRRSDRAPVWIAVEAAFTVGRWDIIRARASAVALWAVFGEEALAVAAGQCIDAADAERAEATGVTYLQVPPPRT